MLHKRPSHLTPTRPAPSLHSPVASTLRQAVLRTRAREDHWTDPRAATLAVGDHREAGAELVGQGDGDLPGMRQPGEDRPGHAPATGFGRSKGWKTDPNAKAAQHC